METQNNLNALQEAKRIQSMIRVLPNEAGKFDLEDLEEIFRQDG